MDRMGRDLIDIVPSNTSRAQGTQTRKRTSIAAILALLTFCTASLYQSIAVTKLFRVSDGIQNVFGGHNTAYEYYDEPYVNRWQRRLSSKNGYIFFKHMRKAGGTAIRNYLHTALEYHGHSRTINQFVENTEKNDLMKHFPFLNRTQRRAVGYFDSNQTNNTTVEKPHKYKVYYIEQEFSTMDWDCQNNDPRWNDSLSVIVLRHPIERHLSEFFYSGPPVTKGFQFEGIKFDPDRNIKLQINRTKLYTNKTYTHALSMFLQENLQPWTTGHEKFNFFKWYFSPRYIDNFQVRALAGCASGECFGAKSISDKQLATIEKARPNITATSSPIDSVCTMHPFYKSKDNCVRDGKVCPNTCDGPCFYHAAAWGPLNENDLKRAIHALNRFDVVLLTETLDDSDQLALLADVLGVPRNMPILSEHSNINMEKKNSREKTHYYRDLMSNLTYPHLMKSIFEENKLEIELYHHAQKINQRMTKRWKSEVKWSDEDE